MGRSSKAKINKRLRASRAALMDQTIAEREAEQNKKLNKVARGLDVIEKTKPNAFLHPNDPNAVFPQKTIEKIVDFRAHKNEFSGMEFRGAMRNSNGPSDILHAKMVGEPDEEIVKGTKKSKTMADDDDELLNGLLNMKINPKVGYKPKKISKMNIEGGSKSPKFRQVPGKKARRFNRF